MFSQKWGEKSQKPSPISISSQPLLKSNRQNKTLPLTSDPILTINRERIASQINYEKDNFPSPLFELPVQKGKELDALQCLFTIYESFKKGKKSKSHSNFSSIFSATYIPYYPGRILIESSDSEACISIIEKAIKQNHAKSIFLDNSITNLNELNNNEIFNSFCYPIQYLSLHIGSIVRIKDPEFQNEPAQIVNVNCDTGNIMVKMYGHIDYDNLIQFNFTSQKALNHKMPNNYRANPAPFEESFFTRHSAKIEIKSVNISMAPGGVTDMIYWDDNYYCDKFMYIEFPIKNIITQNLNITRDEFQRFQDSHVSWEIINNNFIDHMNKTVITKPNLEIVQPSLIDINSNSQPLRTSRISNTIQQSQPLLYDNNGLNNSFSLQNNLILDSTPRLSSDSPPPKISSPPQKKTEKTKKTKSKNMNNQIEEKEKKKKKTEKDTESDIELDVEIDKVKKKDINKSSKASTQLNMNDLTIGSTGLIIKKNLPCKIAKIVNNTLYVNPDHISIGGTIDAFREPGKQELSQIEKYKLELEQIKVETNSSKAIQTNLETNIAENEQDQKQKKQEIRSKRKRSIHSILSESESDSYNYYTYDEYEEDPQKTKKKEDNSNEKNKKNTIISTQTDPPSFRQFDLVELTDGQVGAIIIPQNSFKINVYLTSNQVLKDVKESEINKIIPVQGYVTDNSQQQICLNDKVFGNNNQTKTVIRMHNKKLFVQNFNANPQSFEWIDADEALSAYISLNFHMESENSVIGKNVHRITHGVSSKPYRIEAVSKKGYLVAADNIKFKFVEQGKKWDFDH